MTSGSSYSSHSNTQAWALLIFAAGAIIAMTLYARMVRTRAVGADFCPVDGPSGLLAVGIDATDILSEAQRLDVKNRLETAIADSPPNWRVEVWNVAPASGVAKRTGQALCKPERQVSPWTSNPKKAELRFAEFTSKVNETLSAVLTQPTSNESPILESVQAIGLRSFGSAQTSSVHERRLILVSDLVQNTKHVSFLKSLPAYDSFRSSKIFESLKAPISGAHVDILFLSRPYTIPAATLIDWWRQYFDDIGAPIGSVQRIVG
jgi:hypothetical protein